MDLKTLHIFNPEHDYALGVVQNSYTPPRQIVALGKEKSLLPALYAGNGDLILIPSDITTVYLESLPYFEIAKSKALKLVKTEDLQDWIEEISEIKPWGWDFAVRNRLIEAGVPERLLPSILQIEKIRELSHRNLTIPFREFLSHQLGEDVFNPVKELFSIEDVGKYLARCPNAFFKAPWSSSGRGIVRSTHITHKGLMEWAHGIIRRQGSLLAEPAWEKTLDFATEWMIEDREVRFIGYSVFYASSRGKYHGNENAPQSHLLRLIKEKAPKFDEKIIMAQKLAIEKFIAPHYEGPAGIDMLADKEQRINYCVEINLRMTMGMVECNGIKGN